MKHTILIFFSALFFISCKDSFDKDTPDGYVLKFELNGLAGTIDTESKVIRLKLPYQTNLKGLTPDIQFSQGFEIIPGSGVEQDFSRPVYYTLVAEDGRKIIYKVEISTEDQPVPYIHEITADSVEAGYSFLVKGEYFGNFPLDVTASLHDLKTTIPLSFVYQNENELILQTKEDIPTGSYYVDIKVKNLVTTSKKEIRITQPAPKIISLNSSNFFPPDTLKILTKYLNPEKFRYGIKLKNTNDSSIVIPAIIQKDTLKYFVKKDFKPGTYTVSLLNLTDGKQSREIHTSLTMLSGYMPYAHLSGSNEFAKEENLEFKTINFSVENYRFYQVTLSSASGTSYTQNGVYDKSKESLTITLPTHIKSGNYSISFSLSNPDMGLRYNFLSDQQLIVK